LIELLVLISITSAAVSLVKQSNLPARVENAICTVRGC